ncbi:MAG: type II toxin-antitoxin system VapC family toxin [Planctomycetes bacterium]|nr:type II toxin-antitoxin system VapC family toxin [Planctomycetota bacterium]
MRIAVLDTSALLRLFIPDGPIPSGLEELLRMAELGRATLLAPELILVEAGQVLRKKRLQGILSSTEAVDMLKDILSLPLHLSGHKAFMEEALRISEQEGLSVYDALFLALAEHHGVELVSADDRLNRAFEHRCGS